MKIKAMLLMLVVSLSVIITSCSDSKLASIVQQDMVIFQEGIPSKLIDTLSDKKVVVVGEYHGVKEHRDFVTELMIELNEKQNFGLLMLELSHSIGWMYQDYFDGTSQEIRDNLRTYSQVDIDKIREYNNTQPKDKQIRPIGIDINHHPVYFTNSIIIAIDRGVLKETEILTEFLKLDNNQRESDSEVYKNAVIKLQEQLISHREQSIDSWGSLWYYRIKEMAEVELLSIESRVEDLKGNMDVGMRKREDVMKLLADRYLDKETQGSLLNVGANHAQKKHYRGTRQEWIGEYLQYKSPQAKDKSYSLLVIPAKGEIQWGDPGNNRAIDISKNKKSNELFSTMNQYAKEDYGFISLDNDIFSQKEINLNYHFDRISVYPKAVHDGIVLLPWSTPSR